MRFGPVRAAVWATLVGVFGVVVGCSAEGGTDPLLVDAPTEPESQLPPSGEEPDATPPSKDAGKPDANKDAGPPAPAPGTVCPTVDEIVTTSCGVCGKHSTICQSPDGGAPTWSEYSPCTNELAGGCLPGTTELEACGMCGTRTKTCSSACTFTASACAGQPANACVPGGVDFTNAGCTTTDTFKQRSCSALCQYDNFGVCTAPPPVVKVPPTATLVNYTIAKLVPTQTIAKLTGSCPNATISTTLITPYTYVEVHNDNAKSAVVTIYNSLAPGGVVFKTSLAAYNGVTVPTTDVLRKACAEGVDTLGTTSLTGDSKFSSLDGGYALTIPAGGKALVYISAAAAYDAAKPTETTGLVKLNVRTDSLN